MKFITDLVMTVLGLVLFASIAWNSFTLYSYLTGGDISNVLTTLYVSVPVMLILLTLAWRKREVWWAALNWMFPW